MTLQTARSQRGILIVDDILDNRDMLERRLRRAGFATEQCADGVSALNVTDAWRPDVVILDWMMPGLSGLDTLRALRDRYDENDLPVIMCTALDEEQHVVDAIMAGANDYVTKPINFPILIARLKAQLARKDVVELLRQQNTDLESTLAKRTKYLFDQIRQPRP
ncbi:MAG TPA: response regulator [Rhizomicrobium sp.]|jgi:DNA-binding response OmpR family regulator|nr:response regulator [Rhizomicrobium sp.]